MSLNDYLLREREKEWMDFFEQKKREKEEREKAKEAKDSESEGKDK